MEKLVTIREVFPLNERTYTDRQGQTQIFASRGFLLDDGIDMFYGEVVGDAARNLTMQQVDVTQLHTIQATIFARSFTDKNGATRYDNEIRIQRIS